jgi:glyoxylase-like metal-dependent hydrolase (beta-lactamase superfamily II)
VTAAPKSPDLYFRQLLAGRDFARGDRIAGPMANFVYLIGDRAAGTCVVVDPAYAVDELVRLAAQDEMRISGALATHYHPDHVGGDMYGNAIEGITRLLELVAVPVHCQRAEAPWIQRMTGVGAAELALHDSGDELLVGSVRIQLIHTPGHTPGSQCFLVDGKLVAGDTLFLSGCGRTDLPGGDPREMYLSLTQRLARVPAETVLYPGHGYDPLPSAPLGDVRRTNPMYAFRSLDDWLRQSGAAF